MVRNKFSALLVAGMLCLLTGIAQAADEQAKPVRIGVLAYRGVEQAEREWQAHADYLNQKLPGQHFRIVPLDYKALDEAVARRSIELLITNTGHYTELEASGQVSRIATRLVAGPHGPINRFGGTAIALASRNDLANYRDLKGKRLLIPDKSGLGGWQAHVREAMAEGINLERDTATVIETGNAEQVIRGVLSGQGDAGFVRSDLIESMIAQGKLSADVLNVISPRTTPGYPYLHSTRLYPEWPFARVGDFPEDITKAVLIALLDMKPDDAAARQARIHGWTLPQNYQPVLDLFREARFGPYARHDITWDDLVTRHGVSLLGTVATVLLLLLVALWATLRSNRVLQDNEASLRLAGGVFAHAEEGILITDASGHIVQANDSVSRITGYSQAELIGQTPRLFRSGRQEKDFYETMWQTLLATGSWRGEIWNQRKDGTSYAQSL